MRRWSSCRRGFAISARSPPACTPASSPTEDWRRRWQALATRSAVPVEVRSLPSERLPAAVEATAYFVVAEALTNAAKHARCEHAEIGVAVDEGWAVVEVRDDGVGGAAASGGSGLRGLADRVSALGGALEIESPAGGGTIIRARIALPGRDSPQRRRR